MRPPVCSGSVRSAQSRNDSGNMDRAIDRWEMTELQDLIQRYGNRKGEIAWDCRFAGYQVERALRQLDFAKADVASAATRYIAAEKAAQAMWALPGRCPPDDRGRYCDRRQVQYREPFLPFRIEIYITQARVVMDRVARLLHFAFRPASVSIGSHSSVARQLPALAAEHSITVPERLLRRVAHLTRDVKDLRDRYIVHPQGPHGHLIARGANLGPDGTVRLKMKWARNRGRG